MKKFWTITLSLFLFFPQLSFVVAQEVSVEDMVEEPVPEPIPEPVSEPVYEEPISASDPIADPMPEEPLPEPEPMPGEPVSDPDTTPEPIPTGPEPIPEGPTPEPTPEEPAPETEPEPMPDSASLILLNEVLPDSEGPDAENEFIEIYNAGETSVDLTGWQLEDSNVNDGSYFFSNPDINYILEPSSYLTLFRPETGITLNNDQDSVTLFDDQDNIIDFTEFTSPDSGNSWGRNPENYEEWLVLSVPTPGEVNIVGVSEPVPNPTDEPTPQPDPEPTDEPLPDPTTDPIPEEPLPEPATSFILLNEVLADAEGPDAEGEFIEIYNAGEVVVDLTGWELDDAREDDGSYFFMNSVIDYALEPGGYLVLFRPETDIILNNDTDAISLFDDSGELVDFFEFNSEGSGISWGRHPDDPEQWLAFDVPTPGEVNVIDVNSDPNSDPVQDSEPTTDPIPEEPLPEPDPTTDPLPEEPTPDPEANSQSSFILLNEILANPTESDAENEFIEIYNAGEVPVDLTGWQLDDAREDDGSYIFSNPEINYLLESNSYLTLLRPETGITLNNDQDSVTLFDTEGNIIDFVEFNSTKSGVSLGRHPENSEEWLTFKTPTPHSVNVVEVNEAPIAVIDIQGDTRYMKLNVTGENSYDPEGGKLTFQWKFEAGAFDDRENPLAYNYQMPGEKIVSLKVTDEFGNTDEAQIIFQATLKASTVNMDEQVDIIHQNFPQYSLINEVMPNPEGKDDEGEWLELYNHYSKTIDLSGWYLDDAEGKSAPFRIPDGTTISPNSYLVFAEPDLGLSFKNSEDVVRLLDPNKEVSQEVYYSDVKEDWSFAKLESGYYEWTPLFTPGVSNNFPPPPKTYQPGDVVFESVLPNPEGTDSGNELVVLLNKTSEEINLMGWSMADAKSTKSLPNISIPASGKLTLSSAEFKLSLNNSDERLSLFDPAENLIDEIKWKSSASGRWLFNPDSLQSSMQAQVVRTVDGDTFVIDFEGKKLMVRLIGIDTPETVHPFKPVEYFGKQASDFLAQKLSNQVVRLEFDKNKIDKYGRVLAYVYVGDEMINESILQQGLGYAYTRFPFKLLDEFVALEAEAREAGVGLWKDDEVVKAIEEMIEEELLLEEGEILGEEELLLLMEEEVIEDGEDIPVSSTRMTEGNLECLSENLKIDSFLPNPQKGESVEYIRLINQGSEYICLNGWSLDDKLDGGSKPFMIRGGGIAPGGIRTFRKEETKLALNNKDDCVSLIAPDGFLMDSICYGKTHKNEIFTHAGGDWVPKKKTKKKKNSIKALRHKFKREFISYQSELPTKTYVGKVSQFDEEAKMMVMELEENQLLEVSYAYSPIDMAVTRQLVDFSEPVAVQVYESEDFRNLVAIEPAGRWYEEKGRSKILVFFLFSFVAIFAANRLVSSKVKLN